jgi:hypothetical protein
MGTYHLGLSEYKRCNFTQAFNILKVVADVNPSAAFWAYKSAREIDGTHAEGSLGEQYLLKAAQNGHVGAQFVLASRYSKGLKGWWNVPYGFTLIAVAYIKTVYRVLKNDRMKLI